MTQSFNIPDGISSDDLEKLLVSAPADCPPEDTQGAKDAHFEELCETALGLIDMAYEDQSGVDACQIHKLMLHELVARFVVFHKKVAEQNAEQRNYDAAFAWSADAGKFQAIMNILQTISCGPDDRTCVTN